MQRPNGPAGESTPTQRGAAAPSLRADSDLLRPTLTRLDNMTGFHRPFSPWVVLILVVLAGPLLGTSMLAWNAWRLGLRRQVIPLVLSGPFATLLWGVSIPFVLALSFDEPALLTEESQQLQDLREMYRFILSVLGALVCLIVLRGHSRRFRLFVFSGGKPESLWIIGSLFLAVAYVLLNDPCMRLVFSLSQALLQVLA
jgi:hypothetical protein